MRKRIAISKVIVKNNNISSVAATVRKQRDKKQNSKPLLVHTGVHTNCRHRHSVGSVKLSLYPFPSPKEGEQSENTDIKPNFFLFLFLN